MTFKCGKKQFNDVDIESRIIECSISTLRSLVHNPLNCFLAAFEVITVPMEAFEVWADNHDVPE